MSVDATRILVGLVLLVLGRRLFWLFVGAVGFVIGIQFADQFMHGQPDQTVILFALVVGLVCAALAVFLKRAALGIAGFFAGGYLLWKLAFVGPWAAGLSPWLLFLVGGLAGMILVSTVFNWTLIGLSAIGGASLISESLHLGPQYGPALFVGLAVAGVLVQLGVARKL